MSSSYQVPEGFRARELVWPNGETQIEDTDLPLSLLDEGASLEEFDEIVKCGRAVNMRILTRDLDMLLGVMDPGMCLLA